MWEKIYEKSEKSLNERIHRDIFSSENTINVRNSRCLPTAVRDPWPAALNTRSKINNDFQREYFLYNSNDLNWYIIYIIHFIQYINLYANKTSRFPTKKKNYDWRTCEKKARMGVLGPFMAMITVIFKSAKLIVLWRSARHCYILYTHISI